MKHIYCIAFLSFIVAQLSFGISSQEEKTNLLLNTERLEGFYPESQAGNYFDTTQILLHPGNTTFTITAQYDNTMLVPKVYRVGTDFTYEVAVYLNGTEIYQGYQSWDQNGIVFDSTLTVNKDDVFSVSCTGGGRVYLDLTLSSNLTSIPPRSTNHINVFPSLVESVLNIQLNENQEDLSYKIYSIDGKLMLQGNGLSQATRPIDVHTLSKGQYIIQLTSTTGKTVFSQQFFKH